MELCMVRDGASSRFSERPDKSLLLLSFDAGVRAVAPASNADEGPDDPITDHSSLIVVGYRTYE